MITKFERQVAYVCMTCGGAVSRSISPFIFSGRKSITVICPLCMSPCLDVADFGKYYSFNAACNVCGDVHHREFLKSDFWNKKLLTVSCDNTGINCCFIGGKEETKNAYLQARAELHQLELEEEEYFDDYDSADGDHDKSALIALICEVLHFMTENYSVFCKCGSADVCYNVVDDKICMRCNSCGSTRVFEPTDDLLDEIDHSQSFIFNKK